MENDKSARLIVGFLALVFLISGCKEKGSGQAYLDSISGGGGTGSTPSPDADSGTPRSVTISWNASHAKDVGQTGGGYRVYIRKGSVPSIQTTEPIIINNPGGGVHTTSLTTTLTTGRHYMVITAFSANGTSTVSQTANVVVP